MPFFTFQEQPIYFEQNGSGLPLVLIHGFGEDSSIWANFQEPLWANFQVTTLDLPGFGKSGWIAGVSISDYAQVIKAAFDHLALDRAILVGHSMGGYAALAFTEQHGDRLLGLGLFHSHPFADSDEKKANRAKTNDFIRQHGTPPFLRQMIPNLFATEFVQNHLDLVESLINTALAFPIEGIIGASEAMIQRPDRSHVLEKSERPILMIIGELDTAVPLDLSLKMAALPPVADVHTLPQVGHMGMFEATATTQAILSNFGKFCQQQAGI